MNPVNFGDAATLDRALQIADAFAVTFECKMRRTVCSGRQVEQLHLAIVTDRACIDRDDPGGYPSQRAGPRTIRRDGDLRSRNARSGDRFLRRIINDGACDCDDIPESVRIDEDPDEINGVTIQFVRRRIVDQELHRARS